jgi:hypothetical protein
VALEQARAALDADPARALDLTDEHRATFPRAVLAAERELIAVRALLSLGRDGEASRRANAWIDAHPTSLYARRMRDLVD